MKTYEVKLVSQTNAIVLIIFLLATVFVCVSVLIPKGLHNKGLSILIASLGMGFAYFLWQKFVTGRSVWSVDSEQIIISWTKKFPFSNIKDLTFRWDQVEKISKGFDPQYYNLKIRLISGQTIRFYHDYLTTKDDFQNLIFVLHQTFNSKKVNIT